MKKQYIISEAKQVKAFVEKNKKTPITNTYADGKIYSIYTTSYLFASLIRNWNKTSIDPVPVITYNQKKYADAINENVGKDDYLQMIRNFIGFCKLNKRVPTYITTTKSKVKVSFELFTYCLAKIIVYYQENNRLPNTCYFNKEDLQNNNISKKPTKNSNSQSTSSKPSCTNPYNPKTGCDAMGQNNSYYCGVSALQKCLYKLGIKDVTQKQLASICGTTTKGTSHQGLKTGIAWASKKYNVKLTVKEAYFSDYTLKQLKDIICNPNKAIILHSCYKLKYGHFEFIKSVDVAGKQFEIINSLGKKCSLGCYCGYIEKRSYALQKQYCNGTAQKSLIIITRG